MKTNSTKGSVSSMYVDPVCVENYMEKQTIHEISTFLSKVRQQMVFSIRNRKICYIRET